MGGGGGGVGTEYTKPGTTKFEPKHIYIVSMMEEDQ